MFRSLIAGTVKQLRVGTQLKSGKVVEADTNGKAPYIINVIAGKCPNKLILSGTIAENSGFEDGKTYLIDVRETESDAQYGRRFNFLKTKEIDAMEIVNCVERLGNGEVFDATETVHETTPKAATVLK